MASSSSSSSSAAVAAGIAAGNINVAPPVGERAKLIIAPDWDAINVSRDDWTKRWNREVER